MLPVDAFEDGKPRVRRVMGVPSLNRAPEDITFRVDLIEVAVLRVNVAWRTRRAGGEMGLGGIQELHQPKVGNLCLQTNEEKKNRTK